MNRLMSGIGKIILALAFVGAGIFSIVLGVNRLHNLNTGKYVQTQATITGIETTEIADSDAPGGTREEYQITVEYSVDGQKYVSLLGEQPREFHEGMELEVLYNTDNPAEVILPGAGTSYILMGMGALSIVIGVVVFLKRTHG